MTASFAKLRPVTFQYKTPKYPGELLIVGDFASDGFKYRSPIGSFIANSFGLFNMMGNASEWCSDWYSNYAHEDQTNPKGPSSGINRAVRGGNFVSHPTSFGVDDHNDQFPVDGRWGIGFRVALNP